MDCNFTGARRTRVGSQLKPEVEQVMAHVVALALRGRIRRSSRTWYSYLIEILLPLGLAIPSLRTFQRRIAKARLDAASGRSRPRHRPTYIVDHKLLDLHVIDADGAVLGRPLITMSARIDLARRKPIITSSRIKVSYPDEGTIGCRCVTSRSEPYHPHAKAGLERAFRHVSALLRSRAMAAALGRQRAGDAEGVRADGD